MDEVVGRFAVLRVHQRTVALDARERLADRVAAMVPRPDVLALSTCHRVELYASVPREVEPRVALATACGLRPDDPAIAGATVDVDRHATLHLLRVACGLDSAVQGEGQILGQLRRTYDGARSAGALDGTLAIAIQRALHVAKHLRATTPLGEVRRSVGSLAVDEIARRLPDARTATVLIVGAGEIGKLAARALAARVGRVIVANRDRDRAAEVAATIGATGIGLDALAWGLERSDALISAADTRGAILDAAALGPRGAARPLLVVDVAVPRSVADDARALPGITYLSVDDLASTSSAPAATITHAEERCAAEADLLHEELHVRSTSASPSELRQRLEPLRARARAARDLAAIGLRA